MPGFLILHQLPELAHTHIHWVCDAIQSSHPLMCLLLLPSIFPVSGCFLTCQFFESPKYWSFSQSPLNEYSDFISYRMDWLDLLSVQGTLKSLPQHHSSKASILRQSAFLMVQISHPYITPRKTIALTRLTFVSKEMSLLLNMLSRLGIPFLPRRKHLLISWLQSPSVVILIPRNKINKVSHCFHCFPIHVPWSDGTWCHDLSFLNVEF